MADQTVESLVMNKTKKFCKEFCGNNRSQYKCPLDSCWGRKDTDAQLCDRGNDSILWMMEELANEKRVNKFQGKNNAKLINYQTKIVHSFQFKERWKDWRFGRRIRVPEYIKAIDRDAGKIYWAYLDKDRPENIAQRFAREITEVEDIIKKINIELVRRRKAHTLNRTSFVSISGEDAGESNERELAENSTPPDEEIYHQQIRSLLQEIPWEEKFVLGVLVFDGLTAKDALRALVEQGISIKENVEPEDLSIEDVNYFYRKVKNRLKEKILSLDSKKPETGV